MPLRERWLITGSRDGFTPQEVEDGLYSVLASRGGNIRVTLVHGTARGVDTFGKNWALKQQFGQEEPHPADWHKYQNAAGAIRNREMVETEPDVAIAFHFRDSPGTAHCIKEIKKHPEIELYEFHASE